MILTEVKSIYEGGNALKKAGVVRVKRADIPATIKIVSKMSGIPVGEMVTLGSVGKAATSGDIDLAISNKKYDLEKIHAKMAEQLEDNESVLMKGLKIGSYAIDIAGDKEKGKVQVDLMFVPNVDWAQFSYYSEGEGSRYKGAVRTELIRGVAAALNEPGIDHFEYEESGDLLIRAGRTLDRNQGLKRIFQHRPNKKIGTGYVKTMKTLKLADFKKMFPHVEVNEDEMVIDDPQWVVKILFGDDVSISDVRTAEQVVELIKEKFNKAEQQRIFNFTKTILGKKDVGRRPKELT